MGLAGPDGDTLSWTLETGDSDRVANMLRFAEFALLHLRDTLRQGADSLDTAAHDV
jgi:hypothetical protein